MKEIFLTGFKIGEKVGKSIRNKGLLGAIRKVEPNEIMHRTGNILVDTTNGVGFILGWLYSAPEALFFADVVIPKPSTDQHQ